jgi:hypothetical protein
MLPKITNGANSLAQAKPKPIEIKKNEKTRG